MERELVRILDVPWVSVEFRNYDEGIVEDFDRVIVVRMLGGCTAAPSYDPAPLVLALGRTHVSEGVILPFVDIHCDRVRALLTSASPGIFNGARAEIVGRAFGRVLAHEVYHVLSRSMSHADHGVGMASLSAEDLICDELLLSDQCVGVVRRAFAYSPADTAD